MRVSIIGTGYVGLVTGACLAEKGHQVTCVDIDQERVDALNRAESPIFEAGLDELLRTHVGGRLQATTDLAAGGARFGADADRRGHAVRRPRDRSHCRAAAPRRQIGEALQAEGRRITSWSSRARSCRARPTGMCCRSLEEASGKKAGADFGVAMNPEFLSEGEAVHDFLFPDRIVLGGIDEPSIDALSASVRAVRRTSRASAPTRGRPR